MKFEDKEVTKYGENLWMDLWYQTYSAQICVSSSTALQVQPRTSRWTGCPEDASQPFTLAVPGLVGQRGHGARIEGLHGPNSKSAISPRPV